jgi:glutamate 5-kinase
MKRVVVKVGSHVLSDGDKLAYERLENLVIFISDLSKSMQVILVSSGAIVAGGCKLDIDSSLVVNRQAIAAVGQPYLMSVYEKELNKYGLLSAQVLLSSSDFDSRRSTAHAKGVVEALLENKVIPIINENDTTDIDEIMYGDNDQLSADVTYEFDADLLVILSDLEGYYDKNQVMYKRVNKIVKRDLDTDPNSKLAFDRGGIVTKLQAAKFLMDRDKKMFMASGFDLSDVRSFVFDNIHKKGTYFSCE